MLPCNDSIDCLLLGMPPCLQVFNYITSYEIITILMNLQRNSSYIRDLIITKINETTCKSYLETKP